MNRTESSHSPAISSSPPSRKFREFYEAVAENYPEEELVFQTLKGIVRRKFVQSHLERFSGRLLDIGCNRGYYLTYYRNGDCVGVDLAHGNLTVAGERYSQGLFVTGDAQNLGFLRSETFDCILCSEVIEHVPDGQGVISECYRLLRPGGQMLITTPNHSGNKPTWVGIGEMSQYGITGIRNETYFHTAYRPEELGQMAREAGFDRFTIGTFEKEVKYATRIPVLFYYALSWLNRKSVNNDRIAALNTKWLEKSSLMIYNVAKRTGLNDFFCRLVREGVRSYLLADK